MAAPPRLKTYRFAVLTGNAENPDIASVLAVGRDVQKAEKLFAERGWGKTESRPMTSAAAVAWAALVRTGQFKGTFDQFEDSYLEVSPEEEVTENPTEPAPDPA